MKELQSLEQNNLTFNVTQAVIDVKGLYELEDDIDVLESYISQAEVTEENVKASKKLVAKIRKKADLVATFRKELKNELLEPYVEVESSCKHIESRIKEVDNLMRDQIKDLEAIEKAEKLDKLIELWELRIQHCTIKDLIEFDMFFKPEFLNKTYKISNIESEMESFFDKVEKDLTILQLEYVDDFSDIVAHYLSSFDLSSAILEYKSIKKHNEELKEELDKFKETNNIAKDITTDDNKERYDLVKINHKDLKVLVSFMNQQNIKFTIN